MTRQSITLTEQNDRWLREQVETYGEYASKSEAINDLKCIYHYGVAQFGEAQADRYFLPSSKRLSVSPMSLWRRQYLLSSDA